MPGEASLEAQEYYAHPQNQFWRLIAPLCGPDAFAEFDYDQRLDILRAVGIGLWDTVASAVRPGSLDGAIREAELAPVAELVATLPHLRAVGFNGKTAARLGRAQLGGTPLALIDLPSSSPAYAALPFAAKRERWLELQQFLA